MPRSKKNNQHKILTKGKLLTFTEVPYNIQEISSDKDIFVLYDNKIWKQVPWLPRYWVSSCGSVIGPRGNIMSNRIHHENYLQIFVSSNGKKTKAFIHRLVAGAFLNIKNPELLVVNHKDGNGENNNIENLEWLTNSANMLHWKRSEIIKNSEGYKEIERELSKSCICVNRDKILNIIRNSFIPADL